MLKFDESYEVKDRGSKPRDRNADDSGRPRSIRVHFQVSISAPELRRVGGAGRDRTDDLRLAKAALPQLSYSPTGSKTGLVGLSGFEPLTSRLSAVRSNQLSYRPGNNRSESNLKCVACRQPARQEQTAPPEVSGRRNVEN